MPSSETGKALYVNQLRNPLVPSLSKVKMPWSFYAVIVTFGVFFFSLNVYFFTKWLRHPLASDLWLLGVALGLIGLAFSVYMVHVHQRELIKMKLDREQVSS